MGAGSPGSEPGNGDDYVPIDRFADLPPVHIVIPDDARELDEDVRAYQRELRSRRPRLLRVLISRRWNTHGLSGPLVVAILIVGALVGALTALLTPRDPPSYTPGPLSTRATAAPGVPGGLLPLGRIRIAGTAADLRELRPSVFALVTPRCGCDKELDALVTRARQYRLDVLLVPGGPDGAAAAQQLRGLAAAWIRNGSAQIAEDTDGALRRAFQPREITVVLVRADGVVTAVHRGLRDLRRLELDLARLLHPEVAR